MIRRHLAEIAPLEIRQQRLHLKGMIVTDRRSTAISLSARQAGNLCLIRMFPEGDVGKGRPTALPVRRRHQDGND
jgi:hypothetical protein